MSKYIAPNSIEEAIEEALPSARKIVRVYTKNHYYMKDDLMQEAMGGICEAWSRYDNTKSNKFSTYAYTYIWAWVQTFAEKSWKLMNTTNEFLLDRHDNEFYDLDTNDIDTERLVEKYDGLESEVFRLRMAGFTFEEIANALGISNLQKARKMYKKVEADIAAAV
jgi:RNA polymerase sigma factor (sigma-70 family)